MIRFVSLLSCLLVFAACSTKDDDPMGPECSFDGACDDGVDCTVDTCSVDGRCLATPIDERCPEGSCSSMGCVVGEACESNDQCDDGIECTLDLCGVGGVCTTMALNERCAMGETCDETMGCVAASGCTTPEDCNDDIDCTVDTCGVGGVCENVALTERCAEGETCSPTLGCFMPMPCDTPDDCQDDDICNGMERCIDEFGCAPAESPRDCNDSDMCTTDSCDSDLNMCVFACDSSIEGCDCPVEVPCEGTFNITPSAAQTCAVSYNITSVRFECVGPVVQVHLNSAHATATPLTQTPRSDDGTFATDIFIGGDCEERYTLTGAFTGPDSFDAVFTANFVDAPMPVIGCLGLCANQSIPVTGSRAP